MMHLLERYVVDSDRALNSPEARLCRAYYQSKYDLESMRGIASKHIIITKNHDKYIPAFDPASMSEIEELYRRSEELKARTEDLLTRIDKISGLWGDKGIRALHEERRVIESKITDYAMFPAEMKEMQDKHTKICQEIQEYTDILGDI